MNEYPDTYFLSGTEALKVASQQNRSKDELWLQICYYDGERIESELVNLIHMPLETLLQDLAQGIHRLPTELNFTGFSLPDSIINGIATTLQTSLLQVQQDRNKYYDNYNNNLKNSTINFDEKLRFYLVGFSQTQVMQYVSKNIANALESLGYEVRFDLFHGTEDPKCFKRISEFNPHVTININYLRNDFINDSCFNFIWFQDTMPILVNNDEIILRDRDYVFSLINEFDKLLDRKNVSHQRQSFCINNDIYKVNSHISRENKIVFIGSSYYNIDCDRDTNMGAIERIIELFENGKTFTEFTMDEISKEFSLDKTYLSTKLIPYIVRDLSVLWLCSIKSEFTVEVYGHGWDKYENIKPYYKGAVKYGEDIANIYNSAKFVFAPHQTYLLQQRVLEGSACGATPIVYDCRDLTHEKPYEEAFFFFKTRQDLENILQGNSSSSKDFTNLLQDNSYETFVGKLLKIIQKDL